MSVTCVWLLKWISHSELPALYFIITQPPLFIRQFHSCFEIFFFFFLNKAKTQQTPWMYKLQAPCDGYDNIS